MTNYLYDTLFAPHAGSEAPFLILADEAVVTYGAFIDRASQMAHRLVARGVEPGDRVVVQAPKGVEMLLLYAACVQAGAVFLPLNTGYTLDELGYFIGDADPALVVCTASVAAGLAPDLTVATLEADGSGTLTADLDSYPPQFETVPRGADDLAALLYTSGTTGRSKGAMMSHGNLASNARTLTELWQITEADTLLHALPIFHTHGLFVAMNTSLIAGAQVRFHGSFNLDRIIADLPRSTLMMGVPTFYTRLLGDDRLDRDLVGRIRLFISGSAPLLAETHEAFTARTGHRILERYGMTETNMITSNPYEGDRRAGTVGFALPGVEVKVCDSAGAAVPDGEIGMIEVRGPNVFQGYWQMPEKTAEELRSDGFFLTGDLGQVDGDGYLSIVGREKDLIITGGYNVYLKEIEDLLNDLPGVDESAVIGVPHADFGEGIVAVMVPEAGADLDEASVRAAVEAKLARFKHPGAYHFVEALPRNTMGKVQKAALRTQYAAG